MSTRKRVEQVPSLDPIEERLRGQIEGVNIIDELSISQKLRSQLQRGFNRLSTPLLAAQRRSRIGHYHGIIVVCVINV